MSDIEFEHVFDKKFLRDALKRDIVWRLAAVVLFMLVGMAVVGWALGTPPWKAPVLPLLVGGAVAGLVVVPWKFNTIVRSTLALWVHGNPERKLTYRLGPEAIDIETPDSRASHRWKDFRRLWRYSDIWLLEIVKKQSVLFPSEAPEDARSYVVKRMREAGVRIKP